MQIQPYTPQNLAAGAADRIQVPGAGGPGLAAPAHQPPSLLQVFGREVWKRKRLLAVWAIVTGIVAALVVTTIARPLYKAEGRLSYRPNYGAGGPRPIYTPPNIQSAIQILKANDVFEPVRAMHTPDLSADDFAKNVHIDLSKQSEFIDIAFEDPNSALAAAVTNDLMAEGLKYFTQVREQSTKDAVARVKDDLERAKADRDRAKQEYDEAFRARGFFSADDERENLRTALAGIDVRVIEAQARLAQIPSERKALETARDAPAGANEQGADERTLTIMQAIQQEFQQQSLDEQTLEEARINLKAAHKKEIEWRPSVARGVIPRSEYDDLMTKIRTYESAVQRGEAAKKRREQLKQKYDELIAQMKSGKPIRSKVVDELERIKTEEATLPGKITVLTKEQADKRAALARLVDAERDLGPKKEEINLLRTRVQDLDAQLSSSAGRSLDPHANDLRIHSQATTPTAPSSTNAPKLALAIVGASALLFIGYISLFGLPRGSFATAGGIAGGPAPSGGLLPRALVALVPYTKKPAGEQAALNGNATEGMTPAPPASTEAAAPMSPTPTAAPKNMPPLADPAGDAEPVATAEPEPVQALAQKIVEEGVDRGGVVLFSPTDEELKVTPAIGDLGQYFSSRGDRVLVFDTREAAESPDWVQANGVAETVAGYLNGTADGSTGCFVPTALRGVEYSRVDLNQQISGVLEVHRFRQLLEQMREQYSVVFLVGPAVTLEADHPLLATMAEGMVLVTETAANPVEVHAYLDTLCQQVPARLYGTLAVPKSAA
jgi:uncharacterized protein involved in exopolysaccharide biosynthesis